MRHIFVSCLRCLHSYSFLSLSLQFCFVFDVANESTMKEFRKWQREKDKQCQLRKVKWIGFYLFECLSTLTVRPLPPPPPLSSTSRSYIRGKTEFKRWICRLRGFFNGFNFRWNWFTSHLCLQTLWHFTYIAQCTPFCINGSFKQEIMYILEQLAADKAFVIAREWQTCVRTRNIKIKTKHNHPFSKHLNYRRKKRRSKKNCFYVDCWMEFLS